MAEDGANPTGTEGTPDPSNAAGGGANPPAEGEGAGEKPKPSEDPRVAEARAEAIRERKARQDVEKKLKAFEDEKLSELERATKERDELKAEVARLSGELDGRDLSSALEEAASAGGAKAGRSGAVAMLVDKSTIVRDEEGKPTNLKELVEAVRGRAPELFEAKVPTGDAEGGARHPGPTGVGMNELIRAAAGRT